MATRQSDSDNEDLFYTHRQRNRSQVKLFIVKEMVVYYLDILLTLLSWVLIQSNKLLRREQPVVIVVAVRCAHVADIHRLATQQKVDRFMDGTPN